MTQFISFCAALAGLASIASGQQHVRSAIGAPGSRMPAPAFRLADASGKLTSLAKYRGKVVLVDFWATECGGCRVEIPWFIDLDHAYKSKGLQALGLSMDIPYEDLKSPAEAWARVNPFVKDHKVSYPILLADDPVTKAYNIAALPATFLIDKRGRIAATYVGLVDKDDVEANIKTLLAERQ